MNVVGSTWTSIAGGGYEIALVLDHSMSESVNGGSKIGLPS
jgi:hypothetical protein